jgi:hypothetical protein
MILLFVGIGLFLALSIFTTAIMAAETATFDGKMLYLPPEERINPVEVWRLGFDLSGVPKDKAFVIGKVFEVQFKNVRAEAQGHSKVGAHRIAIFTKWNHDGIEIFWYPTGQKGDKFYLDCNPVGVNDDNGYTRYACNVRGRTAGNGYVLKINEQKDQKLVIQADDGAPAYSSEVIYTFEKVPPVLPEQTQTSSPQP